MRVRETKIKNKILILQFMKTRSSTRKIYRSLNNSILY